MRPLRSSLSSVAVVLCALTFAQACEEDPGRSVLSRGLPQPVGDLRTTPRGWEATDEKTRAVLTEPRIDDKEPVDLDRGPVDAGTAPRKPADQRPFDVGRPPVLGPEDPRSLDASPGVR